MVLFTCVVRLYPCYWKELAHDTQKPDYVAENTFTAWLLCVEAEYQGETVLNSHRLPNNDPAADDECPFTYKCIGINTMAPGNESIGIETVALDSERSSESGIDDGDVHFDNRLEWDSDDSDGGNSVLKDKIRRLEEQLQGKNMKLQAQAMLLQAQADALQREDDERPREELESVEEEKEEEEGGGC